VSIIVAALIVAATIGAVAVQIVNEMKRGRRETVRARQLSIAALFAPALSAVEADPKALLAWQPIAKALRAQFPEEFTALDAAAGATFPFSKDAIAAAHARWTTDWLSWERTHDATYKLKALEAQERQGSSDSNVSRARIDAIEREKLDLYQRRYEEYVRVSKALEHLKDR
jgi:hypothetical protein